MAENVKASIIVGEKTITFEGPVEFVNAQVEKYAAANIASVNQVVENKREPDDAAMSERDLVEAKRPKNHSETVAVLAFALTQAGQAEFTEDDIRRAYLRAGIRPPKVVGQAIRDAKNSFDYIEAGSGRGLYALSNHGDRTVRFDLPRGE